MMNHPSIGRLICASVIAAGVISVAHAQNYGSAGQMNTPGAGRGVFALSNTQAALQAPGYVDLLGGVAYTSNAFLTRSHPTADGIGFAGLDINYVNLGPELTVDALGNVERLEYFKGSFPGTFYGEFVGSALWGKSTDIFQWLVSDAFGEGMTDPLQAPTPRNVQWVNYARSGPYINVPLGLENRLSFFGLYSRTTYELSPYDSQSIEGGASFNHALSPVSSFSAQATDIRTEFLNSAAVPGAAHGYNTRAASLGYRSDFGRTHFSMYAGYNTVDFGGRLRGAPLALLEFSRQVTPFSSLFVVGETGYSTLGQSLGSPTSLIGLNDQQQNLESGVGAYANTVAAEPYQRTSGSLGWTFERARTTVTLLGTAGDQRFVEQSSLDQTTASISASVRRALGPTVYVTLAGTETYAHFGSVSAENHISTVHLSLSREFRKAILTGYALWMHEGTQSSTPNPALASFNDERVGVELTYDLVGHRMLGPRL